MSKDQEKYNIVNLILHGETDLKSIAARLDVSYGKVVRYNRELREAQANNALAEFIDMDDVIFQEVLAKVQAEAPAELAGEVTTALSNVSATKSALEMLNLELQATARNLNTRIKHLALSVEHVSELDALTDALCKLQNAFFNKNATQINIQNNLGGETNGRTYGAFLDDRPGD